MRATAAGGDADFVAKSAGAPSWGMAFVRQKRRPTLMELFVFAVAAAMVIGGAVGVLVRTHPVHATLSLILTLFGVAVSESPRRRTSSPRSRSSSTPAIVVLFLFL